MSTQSSSTQILRQIIEACPNPEKIRIKNFDQVAKRLASIREDGPEKLQVITDFDFTLTKSRLQNGKIGPSGPGVMTNSPLMTEEFRKEAKKLYNTYHPYEVDPQMTVEEKIPLMEEWYRKRKELMSNSNIHKHTVQKMVESCSIELREGARLGLSNLNEANVPVLVFSAGSGDILEGVMNRCGAIFPNVHIISNYMEFNNEGYCIGYKNARLIHAFSKNEHAVEHTSYFQDLSHRPNAIVIGDSMGDVSMANGIPDTNEILKIGFLNDTVNIQDNLDAYMDLFDVVLMDDQTFHFPNAVFKFVVLRQN